MRRPVTGLLAGLAILVASLTLAGYVVDLVALAPGRPADVLNAMLGTADGRQALSNTFAGEIQRNVPGMSAERARALAGEVTSDPRLVRAVRELDRSKSPEERRATVDRVVGSVAKQDPQAGAVARQYLRTVRPRQLDTAMSLQWVSPQARTWHRQLSTLVRVGLPAAVVLAALALLLGPARDRVLRWFGAWGLVAAIVGGLVCFVVPIVVLPGMTGLWPTVLRAGLLTTRDDLLVLFGALAVGGVVLILVGYAGRALTSRPV
jgi:hypothetical protein